MAPGMRGGQILAIGGCVADGGCSGGSGRVHDGRGLRHDGARRGLRVQCDHGLVDQSVRATADTRS
jgi:hypothetical protein